MHMLLTEAFMKKDLLLGCYWLMNYLNHHLMRLKVRTEKMVLQGFHLGGYMVNLSRDRTVVLVQ